MKNIMWLWIIAILALPGCAHVKQEKDLERLDNRQKLFMKAVRWKSYSTAAGVIKYRNPARRLAPLDGLDDITVTSYDLLGSVVNFEENTAVAQVLFGYIQEKTGRTHKITHDQLWWLDEETNQWFIDGDMPDFKLD